MPLAGLPVEGILRVGGDDAVGARPRHEPLHRTVPVEAVVRPACAGASLNGEDAAVALPGALGERLPALAVHCRTIPALEAALLAPDMLRGRVGDPPAGRRLLLFQPVAAVVSDAVVPDRLLRLLDRRRLEAEGVRERLCDLRLLGDQVAAKYRRLLPALDRDRALAVEREPVAVALAEPREAPVLIAEPDERAEAAAPAVLRQIRAVGHAAPAAREVVEVARMLGLQRDLQRKLLHRHARAGRRQRQVAADHSVELDECGAADGEGLAGLRARESHDVRARALDPRSLPRPLQRPPIGASGERDRRLQHLGVPRSHRRRQQPLREAVAPPPAAHGRPRAPRVLHRQRRPRRRDLVAQALTGAEPHRVQRAV